MLFYAIGHYLRRLTTATTFSRSRCLTVFLAATLLSAVIHYTTRTTYLLRYDNLLLIIATPALLLFFSKLTIKPRVINSIAAASLGCYMLQDGRFGKDFFYRWQHDFILDNGYGLRTLIMFIATFVSIWILSWALTRFRDMWLPELSGKIARTIRKCTRRIPGLTPR